MVANFLRKILWPVSVLAVAGVLAGCVPTGNTDYAFEDCLASSISVEEEEKPEEVTRENLETLFCYDAPTLDGVQQLSHVTQVVLSAAPGFDISALAELDHPYTLTIDEIGTLPEEDRGKFDYDQLAELTNITALELDHTTVTDVSALAGLTNLTHLELPVVTP